MTNSFETAESDGDMTSAGAAPVRSRAEQIDGGDGTTGDGEKETVLEMRQVAGLTAGSVMDLHRGSFQFRESDREVGFSLVVDEGDQVSVVAGAAVASVDEIQVEDPTPLGSSVLNVGSACFTVRPPRPAPDPKTLVASLEAARRPSKAIVVPELSVGEEVSDQTSSFRFGSLFSKQTDDPSPALDADSWEFLESIRDARSLVAERHRYLHPNPEELRSRLERLDPGLWDRTVEHPLFARFAVAYSTIPWEPRFDRPELIPEPLHRPIQEMSCLPWVPVTANLLFGPLGIVGGRSAALACARNAVLALACTTSPNDIEFSIVTAQGLVDDWNWTSSLPNSLFPNGTNNYCVAVADGMTHFDGAGFDHEAVKNNEMGLIVLAETLDELPDYCGTILLISPDGQCQVTNHLGERVSGTPIGVTTDFAVAAATIIREAVGDGDAEEMLDTDIPADRGGRHVAPEPDLTASEPAPAEPPLDDIIFEERSPEEAGVFIEAPLDDLFEDGSLGEDPDIAANELAADGRAEDYALSDELLDQDLDLDVVGDAVRAVAELNDIEADADPDADQDVDAGLDAEREPSADAGIDERISGLDDEPDSDEHPESSDSP